MLQLSQSAATALNDAREEQGLPDEVGVRVSAQPAGEGQVALSLNFSEEPEDGDRVTEQGGTSLYIAPEIAGQLDESIIDIEDTEQGAQLVVKPQGTDE